MQPLKNITGGTAGLEEHNIMKTRIIAAAILLPLLLVVVLALPKLVTAIVFGAAAAIAAYELLYATGLVRHVRLVVYSMVMAFLTSLWSYYGAAHLLGLIGVLAFFALLSGEMMISHIKLSFDKVACCLAAGFMVPYLLTSLVRIHVMASGRHFILMPFIMAFMSDTGAYFIGKFFGHHKLAPVISPKKTIEGVFGGVVFAVLGMLIYAVVLRYAFHFDVNYLYAVLYGVLGSIGAVFGDLSFSVIKRQTGIKDYGNLIPGHGGILDRFDSMIVVGPLAEILLLTIPMAVI